MSKIYKVLTVIISKTVFVHTAFLIFSPLGSGAQVVSTTTYPFDYGTGAEGAFVAPAGNTTLSGIHNCTSFTIAAGDTITITGGTPLIIKCTGTVLINGVITGRGGNGGNTKTNVPGTAGVSNNGGGANGGTGGNANKDGMQGVSFGTSSGGGGYGIPSPGAGVGYGGAGGSYGTRGESGIEQAGLIYGDSDLVTVMNSTNILGGSGVGGGGGFQTRAGAGGGGGGGAISITADTIIVGGTGLLTVKGGNGGQMSDNSSSAGGAGGGGSGGTILFQYKSQLTITSTVNALEYITLGTGIDYSGGKGGLYYGGEWGGAGRFKFQKDSAITASCSAPVLTAKANNVATAVTVCSGSSISFSSNSTGGSGCAGNIEYAWNNGTNYWNGVSFSSSSPVFNTAYDSINAAVSSGGSFAVIVRCSSDTGCKNNSSISVSLAIPPSVSFITPGQTKCAGDSIRFKVSATGSPVLTYQWTKNGSVISGATDSVFSINILDTTDAGNYNVIVTGGGACNTMSDSANSASYLLVNKLPVAGIISTTSDTVCAGSVVHLSLVGSSGTSYQWQSADSTMNFSNINGATSALYISNILNQLTYFKVVVGNGNCSATSELLSIIISQAPFASFTDSIVYNNVYFNSKGSTGTYFSWDFNDGNTSKEPDPEHTYMNDSTYYVCLTVTNNSNCTYTACNDVIIISTKTGSIQRGEFKIFPNPSFNILFVKPYNSNGAVKGLELYDITGRLLLNQTVNSSGGSVFPLDLNHLTQGVYYLKINTEKAQYINEIIKQ